MPRINWTRVILGGLLAGLIINVGGWLVDGTILKPRWEAQMASMGKAMSPAGMTLVMILLWGFVLGIVAVWVYASIRAHYGPGAVTGAVAGVMVWLLASALPNFASWVFDIFGPRLLAASTVGALVYVVVGTIAGAWVYKPAEVAAAQPGVAA